MQIPEVVLENLERAGGLRGISSKIPSTKRVNRISAVFQSLSDPVRLSILYALSVTPLCVCVIKSILKIADSKLSYHLDNLRSVGLVSQQPEGKFIVYNITDRGRIVLSMCGSIE